MKEKGLSAEDLGGVGGGETIIRIYCMKSLFSIMNFELKA